MPKQKNKETPLHFAIQQENLPFIKYLTTLPEINLKMKNKENKTYLHLAADSSENESITNYLISMNPIPINAKDNDGRTVLHYACQNRSLNMIKNLIKRQELDIAATDSNGKNILHIACEAAEDISIIRFIVSLNKIKVNDKTKDG